MLATVVRNHTRYCELPREFFFFPLAKEKFADRQALVYMRVVDYKKKKNMFSIRQTNRRTRLQYLVGARCNRVCSRDRKYTPRNVIIIIINLNRSRDQYRHNYVR